MNKTQYNNLMNEGGEGYIPSYLEKKETEEPRIWVLRDKRDRIIDMQVSISTDDSRYAELEAQLLQIKAEIEKEAIR